MTAYRPVLDGTPSRYAVIGFKLKQNANEGCNSCASLAGLVLCFIANFILLVIAPLATTYFTTESAPQSSYREPEGDWNTVVMCRYHF